MHSLVGLNIAVYYSVPNKDGLREREQAFQRKEEQLSTRMAYLDSCRYCKALDKS